MKIGKYKGWEFGEIPNQYGMWAAREVRMSANPHVELVRFARWWESEQHRHHYGTPIEENSVVPYPLSSQGEASASSAWSEVDNTQSPIVPRTGSARAGYNKDLPPWSDYQSPTKMNKRTSDSSGFDKDVMNEMESEADPKVLEEIRALESKLAALKDKAKVTGATPPKK